MNAPATDPAPELSVVIPVYNEEANLDPLLLELEAVLQRTARSFEILLVDDLSTDGSVKKMLELQATRPHLRIVRHRVNSGESAATATGFRLARGALVVTMDADQQNDPADIPEMLARMNDGVAALCGIRGRREDNAVRKWSSRIANVFRNKVTGDRIGDAGCTFRMLRRDCLHDVLVFNGMHRFLPTMLRWQGYRVEEMLVNHRPRTRGKSKYGVGNRAWRGLVDCFAMRWYHRRCVRGDRAVIETTAR